MTKTPIKLTMGKETNLQKMTKNLKMTQLKIPDLKMTIELVQQASSGVKTADIQTLERVELTAAWIVILNANLVWIILLEVIRSVMLV